MEYRVNWEAWIYDGFDDIEVIRRKPEFTVAADTLDAGLKLAEAEAYRRLEAERRDGGYTSDFLTKVLGMTDSVSFYHKFEDPHMIGNDGLIREIRN